VVFKTGCDMLATRSDLFVPAIVDVHFHACVDKSDFLLDDITMPLPRAITNLL
jgi:hypothetical protein